MGVGRSLDPTLAFQFGSCHCDNNDMCCSPVSGAHEHESSRQMCGWNESPLDIVETSIGLLYEIGALTVPSQPES
jgi:hypothetical protein